MSQAPLGTITGHGDTEPRNVLVVYAQHPAAMLRKSVAFRYYPYASPSAAINVGDTFTIGSVTYTFVSSFTAANQVLHNTTPLTCLQRLMYAINGTGVALGYASSGTDKHPDVRAYYAYINSAHAMVIVSETAGTEYAYSYSAGLATVLTPLDGGAWINRDSAQYQYDRYYKNLGLTKEDWDGAVQYGLPVLAEMFFGDHHPMNVIHVGLDSGTGVITPMEVSAEDPYGMYVSKAPKSTGYAGLNLDNANGWENYLTGLGLEGDGFLILIDLAKQLASSGYLAAQLDPELVYDRNIAGIIDLIIVATPQAYAYESHLTDERDNASTASYLDGNITIGEREYAGCVWQSGGWDETSTHMHEYMHYCYKGIYTLLPLPTVIPAILPGLREWIRPTVYSGVFFAPHVDAPAYAIPDVYIEHTMIDYGGCEQPWGYLPCKSNHNYHSSLRTGVLHPLMAAAMGLTGLDRVVSASGTYQIGNMTDTMDVLCIQSPKDPRQVMMLNVYYPRPILGESNYYGKGAEYKGVYATFWLRNTASGYSNFSAGYNQDAQNGYPVYSHMSDTMIEYYGYGKIGTQESRYRPSAPTVPLPNAKAVLIDLPPTTWCGLRQDCEAFGVEVEFIQWVEVDGVMTAEVEVTILEEPDIPDVPAPAIVEDDLTDTTAKVEWASNPEELYELQIDITADFEYIGVGTTYRHWNFLAGSSLEISGLTKDTTYYVRMRAQNGVEFSAWSDPISFTTLEYFWHIDNDANGALVGEVEVPSGIKKIDVTLTWDGHDPISYTHNCSPGAVQTIVIPAIYPGERVVVNYSHLLGTSTGYVDVPEISVKEASVSQQVKLGGNEVVTIESADGLAMCYLCHYNGGVYALVVKDGVGVIYDNLTEPNGFDPLTTESAYKPFLCPDGTPFGAHISISRVLPTTSQPAVICKVCLRRT